MGWEVIIGSVMCPWRKAVPNPERMERPEEMKEEFRYKCKLSGGCCKEDLCKKKPGPEDGF